MTDDNLFIPPSEINSAPWLFTSEVELDISVEECWKIITDDRAWAHWHPEVTNIQNANEPAGGVGNSRTVVFRHWFFTILMAGPIKVYEHFDVWEADNKEMKRYQFWFAGGREEFRVEALSVSRSKFTRTVALHLPFLTRMAVGCLLFPIYRHIFTVQCPKRLTECVRKEILPIKSKE